MKRNKNLKNNFQKIVFVIINYKDAKAKITLNKITYTIKNSSKDFRKARKKSNFQKVVSERTKPVKISTDTKIKKAENFQFAKKTGPDWIGTPGLYRLKPECYSNLEES